MGRSKNWLFIFLIPPSYPLIYLIFSEFPETTHLMGRHVLAIYPFIYGVSLNPEMNRNLVYRKPTIVSHLLAPRYGTHKRQKREVAQITHAEAVTVVVQ